MSFEGDEAPLNDAGFTLVELLIALALLAVLSTLLLTATLGLRQVLTRIEQSEAEPAIARIADHMRRTAEGIRPIRQSNSTGIGSLLDGTETTMRFTTGYAPMGQVAGLYEVEWNVRRGSAGDMQTLVETRRLYRPPVPQSEAQPARPETTVTLLQGIASLSFRYWGTNDASSTASWLPNWKGALSLPPLISLEIIRAQNKASGSQKIVLRLPDFQ
jgi:prepilin-type N-terminal cleavage/methylation domain-containing protein